MRDVFISLALLADNSRCMNHYYARTPVDQEQPENEAPPTIQEFERMILLIDSTSQRLKQELCRAHRALEKEIDELTKPIENTKDGEN